MQIVAVASAAARDRGMDGMTEAYPRIAEDGVAREARIRRRNPEDP